jgi:hypothetical protein
MSRSAWIFGDDQRCILGGGAGRVGVFGGFGVDRADVNTRFFVDERQQSLRGVRFTDELLALAAEADTKSPLEAEAESRWRLVESAWHERRSTGSVLRVVYDRPSEMIVRGMLGHRRSITWVRPGLSGYQASECFYYAAPVTPLLWSCRWCACSPR